MEIKEYSNPGEATSEMKIECRYDKLVPVSELKPFPKNRNNHPPEQITRLAKLLRHHKLRAPIIVSKQSGYIMKGHGTLKAIIENQWPEAPVVYQDFENEEAEYLFVQSDNSIASWAELDLSGINTDIGDFGPFDIELLGIEDFQVVPVNELEPQCDEDDVGEPPAEPITKRGDLWILGRHRLLCGDSTQLEDYNKLMAGALAQMIWTDPPYNVAYQGGNHGDPSRTNGLKIQNDSMSDEQFYQFLYDMYSNLLIHTLPGAAIYVAHADSEGANFRNALKNSGWLLKQCLVWVKQSLVMGRQDYHWKHEPILYGWAPGASHNWYSDRKQTTVLEFNRPSRNTEHPTMKPVELVEYCMNNSSKVNDLVVDPFGGSGTTLIAAEKLGRRCCTIELDPKYCDVIKSRWEKYTGKKAVLENGEENGTSN